MNLPKNFIIISILSLPLICKAQLVQKKYPGIVDKPSDYLVVNEQTAKIIPFHQYNGFLSRQVGIADKPKNHALLNRKDEVVLYPYLIVPDSEYRNYVKKHDGYAGKPENHIRVGTQEVIVLKSSEINTNLRLYHGIATKRENHVVIDGQEIVFIKKDRYQNFISQYPGAMNLPGNYIYIGNKLVVVVPINSEDVADIYSNPVPANIDNTRKRNVKEIRRGESNNIKPKVNGFVISPGS